MYTQQQFDMFHHSINNNNNFAVDDDFLSYEEATEGINQHQTFYYNQASESQCYDQVLTSVAQVDSDVAVESDDWNSLFKTMDNFIYPTTADACVEKVGMEEETFLVADDHQEQIMSLDQICQQLLLNSALAISSTTTTTCFNEVELLSSDASSTTSNSSSSSSSSKESKFDQSSFVEKKKNKNTKQEKTVKKRASKATCDDLLWKHNKFSQSNSYLEINTNLPQISITFEVYQTKRRQTAPLASDKNDINKICEISFQVSNLDTQNTNYVSLKNLLDKEAIYGDEKVTKFYTWIRLKGTEEYLFFYCQTGKIPDVHNIIHYDNGKLATRANHLSKYSDKCSKNAQVIRSKTN